MNSCTWKPRDSRSSFSGSQGARPRGRRPAGCPRPSTTCRDLNPPRPQLAEGLGDGASGWRTSPFSTAPGGKLHLGGTHTDGCAAPPTARPRARRWTRCRARPGPSPPSPPARGRSGPRGTACSPASRMPVVLPDPDRRELTALDQAVDGHVRDAHGRGHLGHGQEASPPRTTPALRPTPSHPSVICHTCHRWHIQHGCAWSYRPSDCRSREHAHVTIGHRTESNISPGTLSGPGRPACLGPRGAAAAAEVEIDGGQPPPEPRPSPRPPCTARTGSRPCGSVPAAGRARPPTPPSRIAAPAATPTYRRPSAPSTTPITPASFTSPIPIPPGDERDQEEPAP